MSNSQLTRPGVKSSFQATYQHVINAPANMIAEIIHGKLYTQPRPTPLQGRAKFRLALHIGFLDKDEPDGWEFHFEPEVHQSGDVLVPDIAGWQCDRLTELPTTGCFTVVPDWVCEVHSDWTRKLDRVSKKLIYSREGVSYLWFVDPKARSLEAFRLHGTEWVLIDQLFNNASVSLPPFEKINFSLGDLWPAPPYTIHKESPNYPTSETTQEIK